MQTPSSLRREKNLVCRSKLILFSLIVFYHLARHAFSRLKYLRKKKKRHFRLFISSTSDFQYTSTYSTTYKYWNIYLYLSISSWILWRKSKNHSIMDHNVFLFVVLHFNSFVSNVFEFLASFISYCNIAKFDSSGSRPLPIHSRIHSLVNLQGQTLRGNEHFAEDSQME